MRPSYIRRTGLALTFTLLGVGASCRLVSAQKSSPGVSATRAASLFKKAGQLLQAGSVEQVRENVVQGLKLQPQSAEGFNLLGLIDESEKKYELSAESFKKALRIAPHSTEIHNNLGNTYLMMHNFVDAEKEFRTILSLSPSNKDANYNLGVSLLAQHRPKDAIRYFQRVQPPNLSTQFNLVQAYLLAGEKTQGLETASRLSATNKDNVRLHFTLGVLLAANDQYEAGARELEIADALKPGAYEILYNLGQAYLGSGKTARAEEALSHALKLRPDSAQAALLSGEGLF